MSPDSYQLFNTWFPAIVVGFVISIIAAVLWDILRRKTWCFAARFWPGILKEVGLDNSSLSRAEVEEKQREVTDMLSALSSHITNALVSTKSSMAGSMDSTATESSNSDSSVSLKGDSDIEAQPVINPLSTLAGKSITFTATAYFPDDTPIVVIRPVKKFFKRYSNGTVKRWKSSIVLQASLTIEPCVIAEIGVLAKSCMHVENRCIFQLGNWAILYYNAGEVRLHILKEGDVPVNVEAKWPAERTGITMRGLYLNGAQVKVATKGTSTTLRSAGPATQRPGELDELHFPSGELDVPGEDLLIFAAKIVEADGISLIVRSEAIFIHPQWGNFALTEVIWGQLRHIAKRMTRLFFKDKDRQPETTDNRPELRFDQEHQELIVEHWKGVTEIELLENRKEILHYLQELRVSGIVDGASSQPPVSHLDFIRDGHSVEHWKRGLQDLNEVILQNTGGPHHGRYVTIRGGIKFLLGDFESALQDFHLADLNTGGHRRTALFERAVVKCLLARYAEALQDVVAVISINPNLNDIQEFQRCIHQILDQQRSLQISDDPVFGNTEKELEKLAQTKRERDGITTFKPGESDLGTNDNGSCYVEIKNLGWIKNSKIHTMALENLDKQEKSFTSRVEQRTEMVENLKKTRNNQVCQSLERYCEECARAGSSDCINHGGPLSQDASVLGKRIGVDTFGEFLLGFGRDDHHKGGLFKAQLKRPTIPASSKLFGNDRDSFPIPFPKLVTPTRPAPSSNYGVPFSAPKLASPSVMAAPPSSFGIPSPPEFLSPIKPAASVPVSAPAVAEKTSEVATPKSHDSSDFCRDVLNSAEKLDQDNDDPGCKEGGVRYRENLGKFVVEYRPPRFKWKLWMGTYGTVDEGRRACDCARFYAGQDKGGFYFKDSPALFNELGPLIRPFTSVSKDVKDKAFNVELKKRAKQVIRKVLDAQKAKQPVDVTRPTVTLPLRDAIVQQVVLNARANAAANRDNIPSSSPESSGVIDPVHEENKAVEESAQQEVASAADAVDPFATLDPFTNPGSLPDIPPLNFEIFSNPDIQFSSRCIQSSLDFADDPVFDALWTHSC